MSEANEIRKGMGLKIFKKKKKKKKDKKHGYTTSHSENYHESD